ncbi:MAG: T9SS type A sorting domain-containing protein [Bacteroidetes bacterium]|nr:T9SS type A sorting domain-containing protein [Bacteroidota bacterium]
MKTIYLFSCLFLLYTLKSEAQQNDSLSGYNETNYRQQALSSGYTPAETNAYLSRTKKQFISNKYFPIQLGATKVAGTNTYNPGCVNMDFETGNTNGWLMSSGTTSISGNSCSLVGCCPGSAVNYTVMNNGLVDPNVGFTINSQFGGSSTGSKFLKMNDDVLGFDSQRITQTFLVTSSNNLFLYSFLLVFNGTGHACCDQPFYNFTLSDTLGNVISAATMPNYSITAPNASCPPASSLLPVTNNMTSTATSSFSYTPWMTSAIDLTPYMGNAVKISIMAGDCTGGAHPGYMYFDALCGALTYSDNTATLPLNLNNNVVAGPTHTLVAPTGFNSYLWNGPSGTFTTQSIVVTLAGNYTLSLGGYGYSGVSQKYFTVAAPNVLNTNNVLLNALNLFPNPTTNEFVIENVPVKSKYTLMDISGKTIINTAENSYGNVKVDVSAFEKGIYFLKLETEVGVRNFKIVKE